MYYGHNTSTASRINSIVVAPYTLVEITFEYIYGFETWPITQTLTIDNSNSKTALYQNSFSITMHEISSSDIYVSNNFRCYSLTSIQYGQSKGINPLCDFFFKYYNADTEQSFTSDRLPIFLLTPLHFSKLNTFCWDDKILSIWLSSGSPCNAIAVFENNYTQKIK